MGNLRFHFNKIANLCLYTGPLLAFVPAGVITGQKIFAATANEGAAILCGVLAAFAVVAGGLMAYERLFPSPGARPQ